MSCKLTTIASNKRNINALSRVKYSSQILEKCMIRVVNKYRFWQMNEPAVNTVVKGKWIQFRVNYQYIVIREIFVFITNVVI